MSIRGNFFSQQKLYLLKKRKLIHIYLFDLMSIITCNCLKNHGYCLYYSILVLSDVTIMNQRPIMKVLLSYFFLNTYSKDLATCYKIRTVIHSFRN